MNRAVGNAPREIDPPHGLQTIPADWFSVLVEESHSHVPLPDTRRFVAPVSQHLRQRQAALFNQAGPAGSREHASHPRAKCHAAGEQAVARRRADGGRAVRVGQANSFRGKPIDVWRRNLRFRVVAAQVSVAEIVSKDEQDIRPVVRSKRLSERGQSNDSPQNCHSLHDLDPVVVRVIPFVVL